MLDLVSLGELLIDFTPIGTSGNGNPYFEQNPGGGPANLACAVAKFGAKAAFIGKVGKDHFGESLRETLLKNNVNVDHLILSDEYKTTLAFVHLDHTGERSFSFYRQNGADTMLEYDEIDVSVLEHCKFFFASSVLMAEGTSRETSFKMLAQAKAKNCTIVFDPNIRLNLWKCSEDAKQCILRAFQYANIVKVSEEELFFLTEEKDIEKAAKDLINTYDLDVLIVTLGANGSMVLTNKMVVFHKGFKVQTVDTTAAGDSFTGGFIRELIALDKDLHEISLQEWEKVNAFANAVGAATTTKKGAISALPTEQQVLEILSSNISGSGI